MCLSISLHGTTCLLLDRFWWNLILGVPPPLKICWDNSSFIKIWQKYVLYMKTNKNFLSSRSVLQTVILCGCSFVSGYNINTLQTSSLQTTVCWNMKNVIWVRVCSASSAVTSGHWVILELNMNMDFKATCCGRLECKFLSILCRKHSKLKHNIKNLTVMAIAHL